MSEKNIKLKIITPEKTVYEGVINQITLPVSDGEVTILPNHRSYIASLKAGEIYLKVSNEDVYMAVSGGFIEFNQNNLVVLADTAERAEEIDIERAEQARKRAEELKKEKISVDDVDYALVVVAVEKAMARIKVAKRYARRRGL